MRGLMQQRHCVSTHHCARSPNQHDRCEQREQCVRHTRSSVISVLCTREPGCETGTKGCQELPVCGGADFAGVRRPLPRGRPTGRGVGGGEGTFAFSFVSSFCVPFSARRVAASICFSRT